MYDWYELMAYAVAVGLILWVLFTGLESLLDWFLTRSIRRELEEENAKAPVELPEQRGPSDGA